MGRLLLINGAFLVRGSIRGVGRVMMEVADLLEPRMRSAGFLDGAPFDSVNLMIRFGERADLGVELQRIHQRDLDLPVAIQLELAPLRLAAREVVRDAVLQATIRALEAVGRKYRLPPVDTSDLGAGSVYPLVASPGTTAASPQAERTTSDFVTLYKRIDGQLHYHEAWVDGETVIEHWGKVGEEGSTKEHELTRYRSPASAVDEVLAAARAGGYEEIDEDDLESLLIECPIEGMGNDADLQKRHGLEARMNELLARRGLGHCDGGSIGSGTMEVACLVVDGEVARRVIEADLKGTPFEGYSRIIVE